MVSTTLKRLLRLRTLQEEYCGSTLSKEAARLRALEEISERATAEARESRLRWLASIPVDGQPLTGELQFNSADAPESGQPAWLLEEDAWQLANWRRRLADARQPSQAFKVEQAKEEFLASRLARRQVDVLVAAAAIVQRDESEKRDQREMDDWFQQRTARRRE